MVANLKVYANERHQKAIDGHSDLVQIIRSIRTRISMSCTSSGLTQWKQVVIGNWAN